MEILSFDINWDTVAVVVSLIFGVHTYFRYTRKSFSYGVRETRVFSIHEKVDGVAVTYKGKPVETLRVFLVKLWNSGNVAIEEKDFKVPITFSDIQTARGNSLVVPTIIDAPEVSSAELETYEVTHHSYRVGLKPMLFNAGESVTVKIIIANYGDENLDINVTGRIANVNKINKEQFFANTVPFILRWAIKDDKVI